MAIGFVLAVVLALAAAFAWQHARYLHRRRVHVQDRQPMLYPARAFHVVMLVKLPADADLFVEARRLVAVLEGSGGARVVYAGKRLVLGQQSQQTPDVEWDFALLCQYPSRSAYQAARLLPAVGEARARFEASYDMGMQRPALRNLLLPGMLLLRRIGDALRRAPSGYPFVRDEGGDRAPDRARLAEELRKEPELGRDAVLVVNFIRRGTREQRARDAEYSGAMIGLMARLGYGPMHMGRAVTVEGEARFDDVVLVYYPGTGFFADMAQSTFFGGIIGGKQLGDTLAMITAPFLDRL
jgi:hypothetical protein